MRDAAGLLTHVIIMHVDVTQRVEEDARLRRAEADADAARQWAIDLVGSITDAIIAYDREWRIVYVNEPGAAVFGTPGGAADLIGRTLWSAAPELVGTELERRLRTAMQRRKSASFESSAPDDRWVQVRLYPTSNGLLAYWTDVTAARKASRGNALLAEMGAALGASRDAEDALRTIAWTLARHGFTDFCAIHLREPDGQLRLVEVAHRDLALAALGRQLEARFPLPLDAPVGPPSVARRGTSSLQSEVSPDRVALAARDAEHRELLDRLDLRSSVIVPIAAHGRVLGTLSCVAAGSTRRFDESDRALLEELARRAALAIENIRLYRSERDARAAAQAAADRIERLQAFTAALSEASTVQGVGDVALHHGMRALGAVAGGVCIVTPDGEHQAVVSLHAPGVEISATRAWDIFPLAAPYPVNECVRNNELIALGTFDDYRARYPELARTVAGAGWGAYLAAPLELGGRAIGCINYNFAEARSFASEDVSLLQALARQATVALERARLFEAEREARRAAEEANRAKSQFLATMSHELRTPLNAVIGNVDLLEAGILGPLTDAQHRQVARMKAGAWHLISVIDEILSFARAEAGRERVDLERIDVAALVHEAIALLDQQAERKGIDLGVRLPADGVEASTDAGKLRQILINLIGNAVKFTDQGGVEVELTVAGPELLVHVRDTGPGIAPEDLERIFEPFTQLDGSRTRTKGGTGLGLAVSRRLAHLLGGELRVHSEPGAGTTFTLVLPIAHPAST